MTSFELKDLEQRRVKVTIGDDGLVEKISLLERAGFHRKWRIIWEPTVGNILRKREGVWQTLKECGIVDPQAFLDGKHVTIRINSN